jgi:hypothetical protein
MMMLRALTISGLVVASTYKFIFIFWFREDFYEIVRRVDKLYEENARLGEHRLKKLIRYMNICRFFQRFFMLLYSSSIFLFAVVPAYSFVFKGELVLPVDNFLPMVDETTDKGYLITLFWHMVIIAYGLIGITSFDISFMTWSVKSVFPELNKIMVVSCRTYHFVAFVDMLEINLEDLRQNLQEEKRDQKWKQENRRLLKKILLFYQEITE